MTQDELTALVQRVEPVIRAHAEQGERERRVPKETADALRAAGVFRFWLPRALGGFEVEPVPACRAFEEIARIDSAAGWMAQMCSTISLLGAWLSDEGVADLHRVAAPVFGDSFAPTMRMDPVAGGWRVTGQTTFASNCHHIDWYFGLGAPFDGDRPKVAAPDEHLERIFAVPAGEFQVVDHWNTVGMRGTGSHDVRVEGAFVPEHRTAPFHPISAAQNRAYDVPLARLGTIWLGVTSMAAVGLGIGRAACERFVELCGSKTGNYMSSKVGESPLTHYRLGEAHAELGAARAYLYGTLDEVWARVRGGAALTAAERCDLEAAACFGIGAAARAIDLMGQSAGTSMVRDESPLSRHARDIRTLTQHIFTSRNRYQDVGAMLLGRRPGLEMLEF